MLLHEKLKDRNIILASNSPRRRELLTQADIPFTLGEKYEVEESYPDDMLPDEVPLYLALKKSEAYPKKLRENDILITADTIVVVDGEVIGKPASRAEAIEMIGRISGTVHEVITGMALRTPQKTTKFGGKSRVWMRELEQEEIEYYVDKYEPYDKAGAYGIQEWIGTTAIERIEGSFYNVMGLPTQILYQRLKNI